MAEAGPTKLSIALSAEGSHREGRLAHSQHGTVSMGAVMCNFLLVYRYGFELARELAIEERARIEWELPHYATALRVNINEPDSNDDSNDGFDDHQ